MITPNTMIYIRESCGVSMRRALHWALFVLTITCNALYANSPTTLNNDDSCDISVAPAATLLLPYFEVDLANPTGETTLFSITNVGNLPQIARVTIWTDWAFPVLTFNIFLTGYDVQGINLYHVLALGHIAEPGTSSDTEVGQRSADNDANLRLNTAGCESIPDRLSPQTLADLRGALTLGRTTACGSARVGGTHANAIGYATIDVVRNCGSASPVDSGYFSTEILFDNVLIGAYQQVNRSQNFAQGNTLVHIRAIPDGGLSGSTTTNFHRTFYSRLQNGGTTDRRQPLPSTFAARWIAGGVGAFETSVKIWRERVTSVAAGCAVSADAARDLPDFVRFDEEENPTSIYFGCNFTCPQPIIYVPAVRRLAVDDSGENLPPNPDHELAGWMYLDLSYSWYGQQPNVNATQSWVIVSMAAEGRFSVDFDAASFGNGCSPRTPFTAEDGSAPTIGPAPDVNP